MPYYILNAGGSPIVSTDYTNIGGTAPTSCGGTEQICAVFADGNSQPVLSTTLRDEMIVALNSGSNTGNVFLKTP
jgi:hypothetical protein